MSAKNNLTVISLLERAKSVFADQTVVYAGEKIRYEELYKRVGRIAFSLKKMGVQKGSVVGVADWNTLRFVELLYACAMLGAVVYPVNIRLPPELVGRTLKQSGCVRVFTSPELLPLLSKSGLSSGSVVVLDSTYNSMLGGEELGKVDVKGDDVYSILYTSGTTGAPKGVVYQNWKVVLGGLSIVHQLGLFNARAKLTSEDVVMPLIPFFHLWAWGSAFHTTYLGAKYVLGGRFSAEEAVDVIVREGVTWVNLVPTMMHELLNTPRAGELRGLKALIGGSPVPRGLRELMEKYGIKYSTIYGGTDMLAAAIRLEQGDSDTLHPVPFVEFSVVKPDGGRAASGEVGELHMRAPWLPDGYHNDPERTRNSFTDDGWFRTGDLAKPSMDGGIQVLDRLGDVIKSGGEWIPPSVLESIISQVEGVASVAVIARRDPKWGERPIAVVKSKGGEAVRRTIVERLNREVEAGRILKWWVPDDIIFVDDIPLTSVGKIDKRALREKYAAT
ncbi:MAG: AMP-binding protein [Thermoprotei archaeon]